MFLLDGATLTDSSSLESGCCLKPDVYIQTVKNIKPFSYFKLKQEGDETFIWSD